MTRDLGLILSHERGTGKSFSLFGRGRSFCPYLEWEEFAVHPFFH